MGHLRPRSVTQPVPRIGNERPDSSSPTRNAVQPSQPTLAPGPKRIPGQRVRNEFSSSVSCQNEASIHTWNWPLRLHSARYAPERASARLRYGRSRQARCHRAWADRWRGHQLTQLLARSRRPPEGAMARRHSGAVASPRPLVCDGGVGRVGPGDLEPPQQMATRRCFAHRALRDPRRWLQTTGETRGATTLGARHRREGRPPGQRWQGRHQQLSPQVWTTPTSLQCLVTALTPRGFDSQTAPERPMAASSV